MSNKNTKLNNINDNKAKNNKKRKKRINKGKVLLILSFSFISIISTSLVLSSSLFDVTTVQVIGAKEVNREDIIKKINSSPNKNIFQYNLKDIKIEIAKNTYVEDIKIKRKLPNKLIVNIKEKKNMAILYNDSTYSYIDKEFNVLKSVNELKDHKKIIVVNTDYSLSDKEGIILKDEDDKKRISYLLNNLSDKKIYDRFDNVSFANNLINMKTINNIDIIMPMNDEISYNISRLSKVLIDLQRKRKENGVIDMASNTNLIYKPH